MGYLRDDEDFREKNTFPTIDQIMDLLVIWYSLLLKNCHLVRWFTHEKASVMFHSKLLGYQRVCNPQLRDLAYQKSTFIN